MFCRSCWSSFGAGPKELHLLHTGTALISQGNNNINLGDKLGNQSFLPLKLIPMIKIGMPTQNRFTSSINVLRAKIRLSLLQLFSFSYVTIVAAFP